MGLEFGHDGVQCTTGLRHDVVERGMALGNRGHPFLQMPSHLRTRNVGAIEGQGVHEGPSRGGRPPGAARDKLPTEEKIQDLMARRLLAVLQALHRKEEGTLRVERWGVFSVFEHSLLPLLVWLTPGRAW